MSSADPSSACEEQERTIRVLRNESDALVTDLDGVTRTRVVETELAEEHERDLTVDDVNSTWFL